MTTVRLLQIFGVAVLVMATNVLATVLYMVVYGHVINPGHPSDYYHEHAKQAAPFCSIIFGMPVMFAAAWWVAGWWKSDGGMNTALLVWLMYAIIDGAIITASGWNIRIGWFFAASIA